MSANQEQIGGNHYKKLKIQVWDFIAANQLDWFQGTIIKYICRNKADRLQDLLKARHCLDKYIEEEAKRLDELDEKDPHHEIRGAMGTL